MREEIKIRVSDEQQIIDRLLELGGNQRESKMYTETYFVTPQDEVLKISQTDQVTKIVHLKASDGKFQFVRSSEASEEELSDLDANNQIKCVLKRKCTYFDFPTFAVSVNRIEGKGVFLIATGGQVTEDTITRDLGILDPEYVVVPFSELPDSYI